MALHNNQFTYKEIHSAQFSFLDPEEIRKMSVLEITNPSPWDILGNPNAGSVYDPRLGPMEISQMYIYIYYNIYIQFY